MDSPEKVNLEAGVHEDPSRPNLMLLTDFTCDICFKSAEDYAPTALAAKVVSGSRSKSRSISKGTTKVAPTIQTLALACGHRFCTECYTCYLTQKIKLEGESRRVQCMEEKCNLVVDEKTVSLLIEPELFER
jgi:ariadne-1